MKNSFRIHNRARVPLTLGTIWTVAFALMYTCTITLRWILIRVIWIHIFVRFLSCITNFTDRYFYQPHYQICKKEQKEFPKHDFYQSFWCNQGHASTSTYNDFIWINRIFNLLLFNYVFNGEIHCLLLITAPATRSPFWSDIMLEDDWRRLINIEPTVIWPIAKKCSISPPID